MRHIAGWGRFPRIETGFAYLREAEATRALVLARESLLPRGNGRAYGDAALNSRLVLSTLRADRLIAFDPATGTLACEAGLLLADLIDFALPRGFLPPVVPGTKFVTVGGMIAADVHGKNHHHAGTFGRHIESLTLLTADGSIRRCSRDENPELFAATQGGMGLTGAILTATIRLMPVETARMRQETLAAADIEEAMALCASSAGWNYTVGWVDCLARGRNLGRSLIYRAEHARRDEVAGNPLARPSRRRRRVPLDFPGWALNRWSVRAFNALYRRSGRIGEALVDCDPYFYPLDAIADWNRIYGRAGFVQYQCVIPLAASRDALRALLERISASGSGSFLAVLKLLGPEGEGPLSFPLEGYTLALDFPANAANFNLLLALDAIVADHGGRLYLAKDARMTPAMLRCGYPRLEQFLAVRRTIDPAGKFSSLLSERLGL